MDRDLSPSPDERMALVGRIIRSSYFSNAESLRRIILYLCEQPQDDPSATVKEYDIAVSAIRRPESFDPKLDPIVRVSISSVRERLRAYFENEGKSETLRLTIPKGQYRLHFEESSVAEGRELAKGSGALAKFWAPYRGQSSPALLLYTEVLFYRDSRGNFVRSIYANDPSHPEEIGQRFPEVQDTELTPSYHFLSAGEMHALLSISRAFQELGVPLDTRNGRFLNWKDFHGSNCVLLGSSRTSPFIRNLLSGMPLTMDEDCIRDREPRPGEQSCWQGRRFHEGLMERVEEYALVTRRPGPVEGTLVTLVCANHGRAIEAAGSYLTSEDGCRELLSNVGSWAEKDPIQVLLRVDMLDFDEEIVSVNYLTHRRS